MSIRLAIVYLVLIVASLVAAWGAAVTDFAFGIAAGPSMPACVLLVLLGMVMITHGGDLFTDSAVAIARATRIPPVIVGATVVSMATTFPEFMVSFIGAINGVPEFAVGNALGSCCCNIGLIVGSCAVLKGWLAKRGGTEPGISVSRVTLLGSGIFMLVAGASVLAFSAFDSGGAVDAGQNASPYGIARWQAIVLVVVLIAYLAYSIRLALQARYESAIDKDEAEAEEEIREHIGKQIGMFALGSALVVLGSRLLVANAQSIANDLGVPELVIGLTVLAVGTSLPEYTISLMAVLKGHGALGLGNIIGANVLNICWVVATCALIQPLAIKPQTVLLDGPVVLLLMLLLIFGPLKREKVTTLLGAVLCAVYVAYLLTLLFLPQLGLFETTGG